MGKETIVIINLWDAAFAHSVCSVHGKVSRHIEYVRNRLHWPLGVTLITDDMLHSDNLLDGLRSRVTVGWLMEPREYKPQNYERAEAILPRLDMLLTHDAYLVAKYPEKVRWVPYGGSWVKEIGIRPKTKAVCQIVSAKDFMPGHRLRHEVANFVPSYGSGTATGPISYEERERIIGEHVFCVVIENSRADGYFTEKLLDCFALGTVPIYWGAPNIGDFFDSTGIMQCEDFEEVEWNLEACRANCGRHEKEIREDEARAARDNLERMREYEVTEDWIYNHILKEYE